jgi:vacuolar-type H+-ATPase subunit E/Vma4
MSQKQIIDDIRNQVRIEIEDIEKQMETTRVDRREALDRKLAGIVKEAEQKIAEEKARVQARWTRVLEQEERRVHRTLQDRVIRQVTDRAKEQIRNLRESSDYPELLRQWIVEAAVGLGYGIGGAGEPEDVPVARIRCESDDRPLIKKMLPVAEKSFRELT